MSFWAKYVLLKEKLGSTRESILALIETKFGNAKRVEVEGELPMVVTE